MGEVRHREVRRSTFWEARLHADGGWLDVVICNVSEHGMMLKGQQLPARGEFVEIASDVIAVVAQVRWSKGERCGLRTRERLDVGALLGPSSDEGASRREAVSTRTIIRKDSPSVIAARSRARGRRIDLWSTMGLVIVIIYMSVTTTGHVLSQPMTRISQALQAHNR
jgi:PilZ domain.